MIFRGRPGRSEPLSSGAIGQMSVIWGRGSSFYIKTLQHSHISLSSRVKRISCPEQSRGWCPGPRSHSLALDLIMRSEGRDRREGGAEMQIKTWHAASAVRSLLRLRHQPSQGTSCRGQLMPGPDKDGYHCTIAFALLDAALNLGVNN